MATDLFIDTSGFYALVARGDDRHDVAAEILDRSARTRRRLVTTDYVVDETVTLLQARGLTGLVRPFFELLFGSQACRMVWMDPDRFDRTRSLILAHLGRGWSFTDCMSFVVMREMRLRESMTKDGHFEDAGFVALLR